MPAIRRSCPPHRLTYIKADTRGTHAIYEHGDPGAIARRCHHHVPGPETSPAQRGPHDNRRDHDPVASARLHGRYPLTGAGGTVVEFSPTGGSGFLGLPGDFTPVSRFLRAVALSKDARHTRGGFDTTREVIRILDNFNVPLISMFRSMPRRARPIARWTRQARCIRRRNGQRPSTITISFFTITRNSIGPCARSISRR